MDEFQEREWQYHSSSRQKKCEGTSVNFLEARKGEHQISPHNSVRPLQRTEIMASGHDSDGDDENESGVIYGGEDPERLALPKEHDVIRKVIDPKLPTQKEIDDHNLTHLPYRNWCSICVKAKGKDMGHCEIKDRQRVVSEYCFDYCFPGDEFGYKLTVLAGKERLTGMRFATAVPMKGASGKFTTDRTLNFVQEIGDHDNKIILKNDQEPSMQY